MKRILFWLLIGLLVVAAVILVLRPGPLSGPQAQGGRLKVAASFYTMAEFARQVGGDKVDVATIIPPGVEPHDYEPTPQDIAAIYNSRLFVYNGASLELWADKISGELETEGIIVVRASGGINLTQAAAEGENKAALDPHVWLDPVLARQEVDNIKDGLIKADPKNRETYQQNASSYNRELTQLDMDFRNGLANCGRRDIVTSHQAFSYLGRRYGIDVMAISGLSPDEEPSPEKLAEVTRFVRQHNIHYIFFERLVSPKQSQTIASETGAGTLVLDPLEGLTQDEINQGKNYLSVQRQNLANLRVALECK